MEIWEEVQKPVFSFLPCFYFKCLFMWVNQLTLVSIMKSSNSLSIPWKWLSTEKVTVPPYFLHTIVSWVCALPLGLWPHPPVLEGVVRGGFLCQSSRVLPSLTCLKALWSPLLRAGLTIALCSEKSRVEQAPSNWSTWVLLLFPKQTQVIVYILGRSFSFRGWMLSLIWKIAFSWGKSHVLGVHTDASREQR